MSSFGDRLKFLREEREMMSKDFAKIMHVEPATVTNWEKGNRFPKEDILVKIADFFDCSIDFLLGRTDNPNAKVYEGYDSNGAHIEVEVEKDYPYKLTPHEVSKLIKNLETVGFDVEKLIEKSKNESGK